MRRQNHRTLTSARSAVSLAGKLRVPLNVLTTKAEQTKAVMKRIIGGRRRLKQYNNRTQENARNALKAANLPGGQFPEYTKLADDKVHAYGEWPFVDSEFAYGRIHPGYDYA